MQRSIFLVLVLCCTLAHSADYPKHMVQLTTQGLGAGAAYERTYPRERSQFKDFDILKGEVDLNYAYVLMPKLQVGGIFSNRSEKRTFETKAGKEGRLAYYNLLMGISLFWNFSEDLKNTLYTGFIFSVLNHEEEYSKNVFNYLEDDKIAETYEILIGKRFSMEHWGIANITYSPSFSLYTQRARKDYDDDGLQDSLGLNFQVIKFDVLF